MTIPPPPRAPERPGDTYGSWYALPQFSSRALTWVYLAPVMQRLLREHSERSPRDVIAFGRADTSTTLTVIAPTAGNGAGRAYVQIHTGARTGHLLRASLHLPDGTELAAVNGIRRAERLVRHSLTSHHALIGASR